MELIKISTDVEEVFINPAMISEIKMGALSTKIIVMASGNSYTIDSTEFKALQANLKKYVNPFMGQL